MKEIRPKNYKWVFHGYVEKTNGYRFDCPSQSTRIVESRNAKFFEDYLISESDQSRNLVLTKILLFTHSSFEQLIVISYTPHFWVDIELQNVEVPHTVEKEYGRSC